MIEYNLNLGEKLYIFNSFYLIGLVVTLAEAAGAASVTGAASAGAAGAIPPLKAFITYIATLHRSPGFNCPA